LIQALEALKISQDYRHALLLAFFSIEQVVTATLEDIKKNAGILEKTIKNFVPASSVSRIGSTSSCRSSSRLTALSES
jgi:hypothetical protein